MVLAAIAALMPRLELYPFRFRDQLTGKWIRARYVATLDEIAARHPLHEIIGAPEVREVDPDGATFNPHRTNAASTVNVEVIARAGWAITLRQRIAIVGVAR